PTSTTTSTRSPRIAAAYGAILRRASCEARVITTTERTLPIGAAGYRWVPPNPRDPRLHLAAIITTVQVFGQTSFGFELSIAQIAVALLTSSAIDVLITMRRQRVIAWPA